MIEREDMGTFNAADVQKAHNELRPTIQKLVDRFGQAQTYEIMLAVARDVCRDGMSKAPQFWCVGDAPRAH
jgi:hypothetical protein